MQENDPMPTTDAEASPSMENSSERPHPGRAASQKRSTRQKARVRSLERERKRRKRNTAARLRRERTTSKGTSSRKGARIKQQGSEAAESWLGKIGGLLDSFNSDVIRSVNDEITERMRHTPTRLNEFGYDPWGLNVDVARRALVVSTLLYRHYFRVETHGIRHLPAGRALLIGNHAGQVALDAAMIGTATFLEGNPPRILRGMGEYWLPTLPFFNIIMSRTGSVVGTPKNCVDLLDNEEAVVAFPEGVRGMNKLFRDRYRLQRFGYGFMRLALATQTPIVPVAVVGSEEQAPGLANLSSVGRLLGMPAFPITLTWPLLGPLGMIPFPVKYRIYFGKPMRFDGDPDEEDAAIGRRVDQVKDKIQSMLDEGVRARRSIFF